MSKVKSVAFRWAVKWRQKNSLDGTTEYFIGRHKNVFTSRNAARIYIQEKYGYIKTRPDLQQEPHGWKMPIPVKVKIVMSEVA